MSGIEVRRFSAPDETRPFVDRGRVDSIVLERFVFKHAVHEQGWDWARDVGPLTGSATCPNRHVAYVLSGALEVSLAGEAPVVIRTGDLCAIPPGHGARTVGAEPCVLLDVDLAPGVAAVRATGE